MKVFIFLFQKRNWFGAFEDCRIKGWELASVESEEEDQEVSKKIIAVGKFVPESTPFLLFQYNK